MRLFFLSKKRLKSPIFASNICVRPFSKLFNKDLPNRIHRKTWRNRIKTYKPKIDREHDIAPYAIKQKQHPPANYQGHDRVNPIAKQERTSGSIAFLRPPSLRPQCATLLKLTTPGNMVFLTISIIDPCLIPLSPGGAKLLSSVINSSLSWTCGRHTTQSLTHISSLHAKALVSKRDC
jgi:hypothetical protein